MGCYVERWHCRSDRGSPVGLADRLRARTAGVEEPTVSVLCRAYCVMAGLFLPDTKPCLVQVVPCSISQGHAGSGVVSKVLDCTADGQRNSSQAVQPSLTTAKLADQPNCEQARPSICYVLHRAHDEVHEAKLSAAHLESMSLAVRLHLGSQPMVSVSHRMLWCSSLATRLTAFMNRFRKEWKPPQCAILKSPCSRQPPQHCLWYANRWNLTGR